MRSVFGNNIKVTIEGGSHEEQMSVTIEGLPEGVPVDMKELQRFMDRRAPGNSPFATSRKEPDIPEQVSDDPLKFIIRNTDIRSDDYNNVRHVPRPGHADFTAYIKYGDKINMAGGGPFSARMTAPLCVAGGIALQLLRQHGIKICSHIFSIGDIYDEPFDPCMTDTPDINDISFPVISEDAGEEMKEEILAARTEKDSIGGVTETAVLGLPPGLGGPMYDGAESVLSPILFGIPAVKGVEFGSGFAASYLRGSENNDPFVMENGQVKTLTNHHGGILGGITSGMPLIVRTAFKPTPSIGIPQQSVDLETGKSADLIVKGRHDPCVAVRAIPAVEAAVAIGLLDMIMEYK